MEKIIKDFKGLCNFIAFLAVMQILDTLNAFTALQKMDITAMTSSLSTHADSRQLWKV